MKYCTNDLSHSFDSAKECLEFEKKTKGSTSNEEKALILKINNEVAQLNQLLQQYNALTQEELQIKSFDGQIVIRQNSQKRPSIDELRNLF